MSSQDPTSPKGVPEGDSAVSPNAPAAPKRQKPWYLLGTLALSAVLLALALRGTDWHATIEALKNAHASYLFAAFAILSASYFARGLRWRILLGAERPVAVLPAFWATAVGYLGNNFLPARAGEVIRSVMIGRAAGIRTGFVFATALTERVLDLVALVATSVVAVSFLPGAPAWLVGTTRLLAGLVPVVLACIFFAPRLTGLVRRLLVLARLPERLVARLMDLFGQFVSGTRAFIHPERGVGFVAATVVIWLMDALVVIAVAHALDETLVLPQALLLLAALGISSAVPSTPGSLGVFQFVAITVLAPFGFARSDALAYIIAWQAVAYAVVVVWGTIGLWRLGGRPSTLVRVHAAE